MKFFFALSLIAFGIAVHADDHDQGLRGYEHTFVGAKDEDGEDKSCLTHGQCPSGKCNWSFQCETEQPTKYPTREPTRKPTHQPTQKPTHQPTQNPTLKPTHPPTLKPTLKPTTASPTRKPKTANGSMCNSDGECQSGYCSMRAGTCKETQGNGSACIRNEECKSGKCSWSFKCKAATVGSDEDPIGHHDPDINYGGPGAGSVW